MGQWSRWLRQAAGSTAWIALAAWAGTAAQAAPQEFVATRPSIEASRLVDWVLQKKDAQGKAFAVVDKRNAHLYVFRADGHLAGHSPVLLGRIFTGFPEHLGCSRSIEDSFPELPHFES